MLIAVWYASSPGENSISYGVEVVQDGVPVQSFHVVGIAPVEKRLAVVGLEAYGGIEVLYRSVVVPLFVINKSTIEISVIIFRVDIYRGSVFFLGFFVTP